MVASHSRLHARCGPTCDCCVYHRLRRAQTQTSPRECHQRQLQVLRHVVTVVVGDVIAIATIASKQFLYWL